MKINRSIVLSNFSSIALISFTFLCTTVFTAQPTDSSIEVNIVCDQANAVLAILAKRQSNQDIIEQDWQQLFSSEGYTRLKKRETSFRNTFTDEDFRVFVLSDTLVGKFQILKTTLEKWKGIDVNKIVNRALAYLQKGAQIRAKIYPVIKPKTNSFVFETTKDPAIFIYLDPATTQQKFENTLSHELHHIGYENSCAALAIKISEDSTISKSTRTVLELVGIFGEGFAMLAAAGGPDIHPHNTSNHADRARWDGDMKNFNDDFKKIEQFFLDILDNKLKSNEIERIAYSFFGIQGPWYTVGWKMSATIEKKYGRAKLIECLCDPRMLLLTYNQAALEYNNSEPDSLVLWSSSLIERIATK
ncbi:MAG: hypothetical protein A2V66_01910 [Ignavibacteria bacterium RBG_13_36_8]|nr:MAG: hypothetical protein A2V66_01910 [Ignavibacteria bacterium RBG_13_36_8]